MTYLSLSLKAINDELNIDRVYKILLNKGLFESWLVTTSNGRKFCTQQRTNIFFDLELAKKFIQQVLNKRFKATSRIGCNYELIESKGSQALLNFFSIH